MIAGMHLFLRTLGGPSEAKCWWPGGVILSKNSFTIFSCPVTFFLPSSYTSFKETVNGKRKWLLRTRKPGEMEPESHRNLLCDLRRSYNRYFCLSFPIKNMIIIKNGFAEGYTYSMTCWLESKRQVSVNLNEGHNWIGTQTITYPMLLWDSGREKWAVKQDYRGWIIDCPRIIISQKARKWHLYVFDINIEDFPE